MSERQKVLEFFEEQKDYMNEKVSHGIETYRKGDANLVIKDENGNAVKGAKIKIEQKNHEFRFGANIFMLDQLETEEKNEAYKKHFTDVFNMATLPFYWDTLEPQRGKPRYSKDSENVYRRPPIDLCMEFCEKHGIEPREHGLAYDHFFPKWLSGASVEEVKKELERRFSEISERYAERINTIEVVNEMIWWKKGVTTFYDEPDFLTWCYSLAEKYFPNNHLASNEGAVGIWEENCRVTDNYYAYLEASMLKGAKIDAIGMQFHLFGQRKDEYENTRSRLNPKNLYNHMDLYAGLKKPLQITEITIPAYSWEKEDEEIQAKIVENLYSIWFSHPSVEQIIYWNLADGYAYVEDPNPENVKKSQGDMTLGENYLYGGLLRFDMSPKPAFYKIKELTQKVWHTSEELCTGDDGKASFRGFYGDYDVEISANGKTYSKTVKLTKNGDNNISITLK